MTDATVVVDGQATASWFAGELVAEKEQKRPPTGALLPRKPGFTNAYVTTVIVPQRFGGCTRHVSFARMLRPDERGVNKCGRKGIPDNGDDHGLRESGPQLDGALLCYRRTKVKDLGNENHRYAATVSAEISQFTCVARRTRA